MDAARVERENLDLIRSMASESVPFLVNLTVEHCGNGTSLLTFHGLHGVSHPAKIDLRTPCQEGDIAQYLAKIVIFLKIKTMNILIDEWEKQRKAHPCLQFARHFATNGIDILAVKPGDAMANIAYQGHKRDEDLTKLAQAFYDHLQDGASSYQSVGLDAKRPLGSIDIVADILRIIDVPLASEEDKVYALDLWRSLIPFLQHEWATYQALSATTFHSFDK